MPRHLKSPVPAARVTAARADVAERVRVILDDIRTHGDDAVRRYSEKFDDWSPESFRLSPDEIRRIVSRVPDTVLDDIRFVQDQVRTFARASATRSATSRSRRCPASASATGTSPCPAPAPMCPAVATR
ncbi:histidinol dehydrogenase [Streptomyces parvulus]|uniref:histidinol dehydrogenase n=1 Tax=Streptomyces parvulus TaxID=146923 RepID=UPI0036748D18